MKRYVPPSLRNLASDEKNGGLRSLEDRETDKNERPQLGPSSMPSSSSMPSDLDVLNDVIQGQTSVQRGGCADPKLIEGSIMDEANKPRGASKLRKRRSEAHGSYGGNSTAYAKGNIGVGWETGAISECGTRESNEDAYLIVNNLMEAFRSSVDSSHFQSRPYRDANLSENAVGLFGLFDGHSGNQAARYAAENLIVCLREELDDYVKAGHSTLRPEMMVSGLRGALRKLDNDFCRICHEGGREWESGSTALVAMIVDKCLIVANLGDCRAVLCRTVERGPLIPSGWNEFDIQKNTTADSPKNFDDHQNLQCIWKEVATAHKPSDEKEKNRIEQADGWVTTETDRPIGQQRHLDFLNEDVVGILLNCFGDRYVHSGTTVRESGVTPQRIVQISRVCGELSVSRALGDRDFKAAFHAESDAKNDVDGRSWESPLLLSYPREHRRVFHGNLVDNTPDFHQIQVAEDGCSEEFLLIGSDGLWVSCFHKRFFLQTSVSSLVFC